MVVGIKWRRGGEIDGAVIAEATKKKDLSSVSQFHYY